jgi:hypothetical protein
MAFIESPSNPTNKQEVDAVSLAGRASLYDAAGNPVTLPEGDRVGGVGGVVMFGFNDEHALPLRLDRLGSVASASHIPQLNETFEGAVVHATRWNAVATTMAATQGSATGLVINSGNITTINTGYMLSSARRFIKSQRSPLQLKVRARVVHFNNAVQEMGFGDAATFNGAHTTGAYWQRTASGVFQPVVTYNGVDQTKDNIASLVNSANHYTFDVFMDDDEVVFTCQDTFTGLLVSKQTIKLSATAQRLLSTSQLSAFVRQYHTGVAPASAPNLIVTDAYVLTLDQDQNKPWPHIQAALDRHSVANPFTGAQTAVWTNSGEPAAAVLSNTTASYAATAFFGRFLFAVPAQAATDYALFAYQVPVPANFILTGVDIDAYSLGAANGASALVLNWAIGVGGTAASLVTTNITRYPVGSQFLAAAAPIGTGLNRLSKVFTSPLPSHAGRFIHAILRIPLSTASATQFINGTISPEGYFD